MNSTRQRMAKELAVLFKQLNPYAEFERWIEDPLTALAQTCCGDEELWAEYDMMSRNDDTAVILAARDIAYPDYRFWFESE